MIGIDEVGRGCWAGPLLVVAARNKGTLPAGLKDSKQLSKRQREALFLAITESCDLGEGWVSAPEIDRLGLTGAMQLAVERALIMLGAATNEEIIMDGSINYCKPSYTRVQTIVKADSQYPIVSAASIYAKVQRDNYMAEAAQQLPGYGFDRHVGYGTAAHLKALQEHGITELHRRSFKPVQVFS